MRGIIYYSAFYTLPVMLILLLGITHMTLKMTPDTAVANMYVGSTEV